MATNRKSALPSGTVLHGEIDYTIKGEPLGEGGFGITYYAEAKVLRGNIPQLERYTIKEFYMDNLCYREPNGTVTATIASKKDMQDNRADFLKEARLLQNIGRHNGIVPVNEVFEANGTVYYVMQFLGKRNLTKYVAENGGKLDETKAKPIIRKVAEALSFLHSKKMTHLDVKPDNIMMTEEDEPVLIDFGLAKHYNKSNDPTSKLGAYGTSDGYSPLEQYAGITSFSPQTDIYALGATFYYMLTGSKPRRAGELAADPYQKQLKTNLLEVSTRTMAAILSAMKPMATERPESIDAFLQVLGEGDRDYKPHSTDETDGGDKTQRITPTPLPVWDKWKPYIIGLAAVIVIAAITTLFWPDAPKTSDPVSKPTTDTLATEVTDSIPQNTTDNKEESAEATNDSKEKPVEKPVTPPARTTSEADNFSPTPSRAEPVITKGSKAYSYGHYRGELKNNLPHGSGTLTFTSSHDIEGSGHVANAGDRLEGDFNNGHFNVGKLIRADGTKETIMIGSF